MKFWKHHEPEFDEDKFAKFIETVVLETLGGIMADLTRLTAAVNAQAPEIAAVKSKVDAQGARITDLEAQVSAGGGVDQAALDALAATLEANNETLKTTGA